jgi:hypothetical protein
MSVSINLSEMISKAYAKGASGEQVTPDFVSDVLKEAPMSEEDKQAVAFKVLSNSSETGLEDMLSSLSMKDPLQHIVAYRGAFADYFNKSIRAYHYVLDDPIKEARWESINAEILKASGCTVTAQSNGSHKSGADLVSENGTYSNKTACYDGASKKSFKVSSYRLTSVCSNRDPGNINEIITEINDRKNFSYYSILVREETEENIQYDWYIIPADVAVLNPGCYEWCHVNDKKGKVTGWKSNDIQGCSMSISFSMSSQLWITVRTEAVKQYLVSSTMVPVGSGCGFIHLHDLVFPSHLVSEK